MPLTITGQRRAMRAIGSVQLSPSTSISMVGLMRRAASARLRPFAADLVGEGEHLAVEVGDLEAVRYRRSRLSDAGPRQRHEGSTAHAADAADEHPRLPQQLLARARR